MKQAFQEESLSLEVCGLPFERTCEMVDPMKQALQEVSISLDVCGVQMRGRARDFLLWLVLRRCIASRMMVSVKRTFEMVGFQ
jgi:hypothetical protein